MSESTNIPQPSALVFDMEKVSEEINRILEEMEAVFSPQAESMDSHELDASDEISMHNLEHIDSVLAEKINHSVELTAQVNRLLLESVDHIAKKSL